VIAPAIAFPLLALLFTMQREGMVAGPIGTPKREATPAVRSKVAGDTIKTMLECRSTAESEFELRRLEALTGEVNTT
jgi:hypothetical protein